VEAKEPIKYIDSQTYTNTALLIASCYHNLIIKNLSSMSMSMSGLKKTFV